MIAIIQKLVSCHRVGAGVKRLWHRHFRNGAVRIVGAKARELSRAQAKPRRLVFELCSMPLL